MNEQQLHELSEIVASVPCQRSHACTQSGSSDICKARDLGLEDYVDCLSDCPRDCQFAMCFGDGHLCTCTARVFLAKHGV
ncbi:MAG TPA: hypothetical protein VFG89_00455 [Coriobacteriia bacterium]|nr:hypothetical protein [Coriobacteriia bacterium]